jgi:hypothetical protein
MITRRSQGIQRVLSGAGSCHLRWGFAIEPFSPCRLVPAISGPFVDNPWTLDRPVGPLPPVCPIRESHFPQSHARLPGHRDAEPYFGVDVAQSRLAGHVQFRQLPSGEGGTASDGVMLWRLLRSTRKIAPSATVVMRPEMTTDASGQSASEVPTR